MTRNLLRRAGWTGAGLVVLAALLAMVTPVAAQTADGTVEVVVVDQSGAALPGVTVTVKGPATGFERVTVTGGDGTARIPAIPPGTYTVSFVLPGFSSVVQEGLELHVGQTARLNAALKVAQLNETVNVVAEASLVDVYKTDSSTNIVPEQIQQLPVADRDFQRLAFLAPGVQRERGSYRFISNAPVIGAGGNASQSTIMVDGVDFTDPTLGLARARFSQDAINEFRVISNRFDPEIGGSAGGALSIVTKSGTNTMSGSGFAFFRNNKLRSKSKFEAKKNDYSRQQAGFTLGGPIVKDRTHFFGSFEYIDETAITLFRPGGVYASRAADIEVPLKQPLVYTGVDHQMTDSQTLRLKFVYEHYSQENFRVGGVADESSGFQMKRNNVNFSGTHAWTISDTTLNQLAVQVGRRKFEEPNNSTALSEYFSSGNTLITGANITGNQNDTGDIIELRDTVFTRVGQGRWATDFKFGGAWQHVKDDWDFPVYPTGLMLYVTDTRALPQLYAGATGSGQSVVKTDLLSGFAQAGLRPATNVSVNLGLRYDLDTEGNNPDFTSPLQPEARGRDTNNLQPRAGFSWDLDGKGTHVIRGGAGVFTGRYLLVPAHVELQQNGFTGRIIQQRFNGALLGLPAAFWLDAANPTTTGIALARDAGRMDSTMVSPHATQVTGGYTARLGRTGLFLDFEGIYAKGDDEVIIRDTNFKGNATGGRISSAFNQINAYTNEGRSEYKAFVSSLNGRLKGGHVVTASFTVADKKNINDDFSPALTDYPNDPSNIEAEYGRSRADERYRFVASGVFRLPYSLTVAPIFDYGSGQPWNHRLGYDYNGDGKQSDRPVGVGRFTEDGPKFAAVNLRVTYVASLSSRVKADLILEFFNLTNRDNYDVNSLQNGEFLSGPTLANSALVLTPNPRFGQYTSTLPPFETQLGFRVRF